MMPPARTYKWAGTVTSNLPPSQFLGNCHVQFLVFRESDSWFTITINAFQGFMIHKFEESTHHYFFLHASLIRRLSSLSLVISWGPSRRHCTLHHPLSTSWCWTCCLLGWTKFWIWGRCLCWRRARSLDDSLDYVQQFSTLSKPNDSQQ